METKIIGNKIAEARKKTNISQAQLAERLFISPQAVGKWERGESLPDIIALNRLAEILEVDLNYFSENFQSANTGIESAEAKVKQPDESPSERPGKKFSWNMSRGNWVDADFSGLKGLHEKFSSSHMRRCKFIGSDLSGLLLKNNHVESCDFSGSQISNSHIQNSHLAKDIFKNGFMNETEFIGSHIEGCDFSDTDLTGVVIKGSDFRKNTVANSVWKGTSFIASHIGDIVFDSTIADCSFENCGFSRVTFQNSMLINTFFKCNTLKGLRFIDCQADRLTYEFLKNGKADLTGLTLLTS